MKSLEDDAAELAKKHKKHADAIWSVTKTPPGDEAVTIVDGLEMIAFDAGYEGSKLAKWVKELGPVLGVDVEKLHADGIAMSQSMSEGLSMSKMITRLESASRRR